MNPQESIQRWDAFLQKMRERARELFDPVREQALAMFIESGNDALPIGNALSAIRLQMLALCSKADDTWSEKVSDLMHDAGVTGGDFDREAEKRDYLRYSLELDFAMLELEVKNQMALQIRKAANSDQIKTFACTQCLAQLEVPPHTYKAEHVICRFCQTVNTYEPGTYQRMLGGYLHDMARWNAREEMKNEMEVKYQADKADEKTRAKAKSAHREAYRRHLEKYLSELKTLNPTTDIEKEMIVEMKRFDM